MYHAKSFEDGQEFFGSVINYEDPNYFSVRPYNPDFEIFMCKIKSSLNSRRILTRNECSRNMKVIYHKEQSGSIYRSEVINMNLRDKSWLL